MFQYQGELTMAGNTFGTAFRITTFGESHGRALGVTIDGCPAGIALDESLIQRELDRRRPGAHATASEGTKQNTKLNPAGTSRKEADACEILSGVFEGKTTGTAISIVVRNTDQHSADYSDIATKFRPGHADYPYTMKYGVRDYRGGGRSSGRETIGRVAAGAVAKAFLATKGIHIKAWTSEAVGISCGGFDEAAIEENAMRACDNTAAELMMQRIIELKAQGDSGGGIVTCRVQGLPAGIGEPVFDKLYAMLAFAVLSVGAIKGIEFGSGFESARMTGSTWNDPMRHGAKKGAPEFVTNHAGGVLGGISTGADLVFRAAVKPVPSISLPQKTIDTKGKNCEIEVRGRHDVCLCPRIVPVIEAMTALTVIDLYLRNLAIHA
jgi:chorismate synthase